MDDSYFFGILAYLFIASAISGILPDDFYSGTHNAVLDSNEFREVANANIEDIDTLGGQLSFFDKVLSFLFITWNIDDIPVFFALILLFINLASLLVVSIYAYDKIRGIS